MPADSPTTTARAKCTLSLIHLAVDTDPRENRKRACHADHRFAVRRDGDSGSDEQRGGKERGGDCMSPRESARGADADTIYIHYRTTFSYFRSPSLPSRPHIKTVSTLDDSGAHKSAEGTADERHTSRRDSVPHNPWALASFRPDRRSRSSSQWSELG